MQQVVQHPTGPAGRHRHGPRAHTGVMCSSHRARPAAASCTTTPWGGQRGSSGFTWTRVKSCGTTTAHLDVREAASPCSRSHASPWVDAGIAAPWPPLPFRARGGPWRSVLAVFVPAFSLPFHRFAACRRRCLGPVEGTWGGARPCNRTGHPKAAFRHATADVTTSLH